MSRTAIRSLATRLLPLRQLAARALRGRGLVLALHRVDDAFAGDGLTLSADQFDTYCRYLSDHFDVVPFDEIVSRLAEGRGLDGHVAITFDDGYRDNHEVAAPILEKHGLPATFFVTTGFIESEVVAPWDASLSPAPAWMSWDQVRSLKSSGFSIGGHTVDHVDLGAASEALADQQLKTCRQTLHERLGEPPDLFAYPFGGPAHMSEANRALVREAGFRCCASCHGGLVSQTSDPFALPRVGLSSWYADPDTLALDLVRGRL